MYYNGWFQLFMFIRFGIAFCLIFLAVPGFIFRRSEDSIVDDEVASFIRMVAVVIIIGYVLVLAKIYEVITILMAFLFLIYRKYARTSLMSDIGHQTEQLQLYIYDYLDGKAQILHPVHAARGIFKKVKAYIRDHVGDRETRYFNLMLLILMGLAAYLRFRDVWVHAAPPLSDAYTTLAWMKHIGRKVLFYSNGGGVYPRGFSIYLETLAKFAFIDPFYVFRYVGPLNSVFAAFGCYFAISRITGSRLGGFVSAAAFGLLAPFLGTDWERQSAINSQEFALVFMAPAVYFSYRYLKQGRNQDLLVAAAAYAVIGWVHTLVFAFTALMVGALLIMALIFKFREYGPRVLRLMGVGVIAAVLSVIPIAIGRLMGVEIHSSSQEFLVQKVAIATLPGLDLLDKLALISVAVCLIGALFRLRELRKLPGSVVIAGVVLAVFGVYYYGGVLTHSQMLVTRSKDFWALAKALAYGGGVAEIFRWIPKFSGKRWLETVTAALIIVICWFGFHPQPCNPYKMQWDSDIEQYLAISNKYLPDTWMIVSDEEDYSIVLGKGFHFYITGFLPYNPRGLKKAEWYTFPEYIFIYYHKELYKVSTKNSIYVIEKPIYQRREKEQKELAQWLTTYRSYHKNIQVFYEDRHLRVYRIHNPIFSKKNNEKAR